MNDFGLYVTLSLIAPIVFLLGMVFLKMLRHQALPDSRYTPFDTIMGQAAVEFQEHKEEREEEDDHGDDKDKNEKQRAGKRRGRLT